MRFDFGMAIERLCMIAVVAAAVMIIYDHVPREWVSIQWVHAATTN